MAIYFSQGALLLSNPGMELPYVREVVTPLDLLPTITLPYISGAITNPAPMQGGTASVTSDSVTDTYGSAVIFGVFHLFPSSINVGNVLTDQDQTYSLWNPTFADTQLTSVVKTGVVGITFLNDVTAPKTFAPFESATITIRVLVDGPPTVASIFSYYTGLNNVSISLEGTRVVAFIPMHNWKVPLLERVKWNVASSESYSGKVFKELLSSSPRREFESEHLVIGEDRRLLDALLWSGHYRLYLIPLWCDVTVLTQSVSVADTTVYMDTSDLRFVVDGFIAIVHNQQAYEIAKITEVYADRVVLADGLLYGWNAGSLAFPSLLARIAGKEKTNNLSSETARVKITWEILESIQYPQAKLGEVMPAITSIPSPPDLADVNNSYIYTKEPEWSEGLDSEIYSEFDTESFPFRTADLRIKRRDEHEFLMRYSWVLTTRSDIAAHRSWLNYLSGKYNSFLIPTYLQDMKILYEVTSGQSALRIARLEYGDSYANMPGRRILRIEYIGGATRQPIVDFRPILGGTVVNADEEDIMLDSALTDTILTSEINLVRLSFVFLAEQSGNIDEYSWLSPTIAKHSTVAKLRHI